MPDTNPAKPAHKVTTESCCKRIRVEFNGEIVADTTRGLYLFEPPITPVYYFPLDDVRAEFLERTEHFTHCPFKGDAVYWDVIVGDRAARNAVWAYPSPIEAVPELAGYAAFYWNKMDRWFEEDEEIFVHARDPHVRLDVLPSSRKVEVSLNGETLASSERALFVFETGLPVRYYVPRDDVSATLLPSDLTTACPYKGVASYWHVEAGGETLENLVWSYRDPVREAGQVRDYLCFFNEKVDIAIDGETQERPKTKWSA
ncbi:MAG: DUF427 domain-containing protein [Minwuia sp.]|uniref:DUF427 domain-containing protein n=1 Tax=Minwuia sp. TaxID=2493630 RepID=UPI003A86EAC6